MVSSIDPTLPANAPAQAVKGDLRANLGFAKTEIEALQSDVAAIGTSGAFQPMVDIRQFGTRNGTNDTTMVKTALTSIQTGANAGRVLWVPAGVYALNPTGTIPGAPTCRAVRSAFVPSKAPSSTASCQPTTG